MKLKNIRQKTVRKRFQGKKVLRVSNTQKDRPKTFERSLILKS